MLKNLLSLVCLLLAGGLFAQNVPFSVSNTEPVVNSEMKDDVEAHVGVVNLTDSTINIVWEREEVILPMNWASAICDPVRCWSATVDTKIFEIPVGARDIEVIAHVYPDIAIPGTAVIRVKMYEDDHPDLSITVEYTFNVGVTTGLTEIEERSIKLFPNPTQGHFNMDVALSESKAVQLRLVNSVGQTVYVKDYGQLSGQHRLTYEGAELPQGMYYLMLDVEEATSAFKLSVIK